MLAKFARLFDKKQVKSWAIFVFPNVQMRRPVGSFFFAGTELGKQSLRLARDWKNFFVLCKEREWP
jgi:hypothetical protein